MVMRQGLFLACKTLVKEFSTIGFGGKEFYLHQKSVSNLLELEGNLSFCFRLLFFWLHYYFEYVKKELHASSYAII